MDPNRDDCILRRGFQPKIDARKPWNRQQPRIFGHHFFVAPQGIRFDSFWSRLLHVTFRPGEKTGQLGRLPLP